MAELARQSSRPLRVGRTACITAAGAAAASVAAPQRATRRGWASRRDHLMRREEAHLGGGGRVYGVSGWDHGGTARSGTAKRVASGCTTQQWRRRGSPAVAPPVCDVVLVEAPLGGEHAAQHAQRAARHRQPGRPHGGKGGNHDDAQPRHRKDLGWVGVQGEGRPWVEAGRGEENTAQVLRADGLPAPPAHPPPSSPATPCQPAWGAAGSDPAGTRRRLVRSTAPSVCG